MRYDVMTLTPSFHQFVMASILLVGLLSPFQTVFACELMDGKTQYVCCCDEAGEISKGCAVGDSRQNQLPMAEGDCCEVSYLPAPGSTAIAQQQQAQLLLLDAPQPPPLPAYFAFQTILTPNGLILYITDSSPPAIGTRTYLLTNRFRI